MSRPMGEGAGRNMSRSQFYSQTRRMGLEYIIQTLHVWHIYLH